MSAGLAVMLVGVFVVPIALLWTGHRLRRRPPRWRAIFWGALLGYLVGASLSLIASMIPPEMWSAQDTLRGLAGYWALVISPVVGAASRSSTRLGAIRRASRSTDPTIPPAERDFLSAIERLSGVHYLWERALG